MFFVLSFFFQCSVSLFGISSRQDPPIIESCEIPKLSDSERPEYVNFAFNENRYVDLPISAFYNGGRYYFDLRTLTLCQNGDLYNRVCNNYTAKINMRKGTFNNTLFRFPGVKQGIYVHIRNNTNFYRVGNDLHLMEKISPTKASFGYSRIITLPDDSQIEFNYFKYKGKNVTYPNLGFIDIRNSTIRGDFIVDILVSKEYDNTVSEDL